MGTLLAHTMALGKILVTFCSAETSSEFSSLQISHCGNFRVAVLIALQISLCVAFKERNDPLRCFKNLLASGIFRVKVGPAIDKNKFAFNKTKVIEWS
jgi:hypothetical protein